MVSSVYFDPKSRINHLIYGNHYEKKFMHIALTEEGIVLHNTTFVGPILAEDAVIKGADDGKHLFIALKSDENEKYTVAFTESSDGGITWTSLSYILKEGLRKYVQDMLYIEETGRLAIFFIDEKHELRMVTRPQGSSIFSNEFLIARDAYNYVFNTAKATYTTDKNIQIFHLFYINSVGKLIYVQSRNIGLTWTIPKIIDKDEIDSIVQVTSHKNVPGMITIAYSPNGNPSPARLIGSKDAGVTFSDPMQLTTKNVWRETNQGVAFCAAKGTAILASFFGTYDEKGEYSIWKNSELKPALRAHVFETPDIRNAGATCVVENNGMDFSINLFATRYFNAKWYLYYAREYDTISAITNS